MNKNFKAENPCNMDLLSGGGGQREASDWTTKNPYCHPELDSGSGQCRGLSVTPVRFRIKYGMTLKKITMVCGFTMAEILLSLTIIGVVAAITLPSLTGNINERTWNTQRKALYARFSQAIALMPALNGYGTLTEGDSSTSAVDTAAETFVTNGLAKVLKINNICDSEHLEDCGITSKITPLSGGSAIDVPTKISELNSLMTSVATWTDINGVVHSAESMIDTNAAAFETQNGESIVVYYKPDCTGSLGESNFHYTQNKICANFIYDLNGSKGPNTVGKDIGVITALYPSDSIVVAPFPLTRAASTSISYTASSKECTKIDNESRLPNLEELISMFVNAKLFAMPTGIYWSSSLTTSSGATQAWAIDFNQGRPGKYNKTSSWRLWCVKR